MRILRPLENKTKLRARFFFEVLDPFILHNILIKLRGTVAEINVLERYTEVLSKYLHNIRSDPYPYDGDHFFEILATGEYQLLKKVKISSREIINQYSREIYEELSAEETFFIAEDNQAAPIVHSKDFFLDYFPDSPILEWTKANRLSLKKEKDLIALFHLINVK